MTTPDPEAMSAPEPAAERLPAPVPAAHLSPPNICLVAAGGAVGTALRYGLTLLLPATHGIPVAILAANILGAFVLGLLLEALSELGPDDGVSRRIRLGAGTGVLGGFTTYSTLATDTVLLGLAAVPIAIAYGVATVVVGGLASIAGIALARRLIRPVIRDRQTAT